jgi:transposase
LHRASSANAETFLDFLRLLTEKYSDQFIVLVLGKARIHHTKMMQAFLDCEAGDAFHFIFFPPYPPHLNLIERLWKWLKGEVIDNVFTRIGTTLPNSLLALNSTSYNIPMKCCVIECVV